MEQQRRDDDHHNSMLLIVNVMLPCQAVQHAAVCAPAVLLQPGLWWVVLPAPRGHAMLVKTGLNDGHVTYQHLM
jgi:hypothetical protein